MGSTLTVKHRAIITLNGPGKKAVPSMTTKILGGAVNEAAGGIAAAVLGNTMSEVEFGRTTTFGGVVHLAPIHGMATVKLPIHASEGALVLDGARLEVPQTWSLLS